MTSGGTAQRMEDDRVSNGDASTDARAAACAEEERLGYGPRALYNGRVVLTLSAGSACWYPGFKYSRCTETLALYRLQVPPEDLELPLRRALDTPEVRRYLCFNSTLCLTLLAPALYLMIWCGLFSSFHLLQSPFSQEHFATFCLTLSAAAIVLTGAIVLVLHRHHGKISVNTEVRLTQANEILRNHHLLVGLSDRMENCSSRLHLSFCYFDVRECLKRLTRLLDGEPDHMCHLLEVASQLLALYSALYVKLLATRGLPQTGHSLHAKEAGVPCLCQHIETAVGNGCGL